MSAQRTPPLPPSQSAVASGPPSLAPIDLWAYSGPKVSLPEQFLWPPRGWTAPVPRPPFPQKTRVARCSLSGPRWGPANRTDHCPPLAGFPPFPPFLNSLPPPLDMPPARYLRETSPNWFAVLSYRCTPIPDGSSHSSGPIEGAAWRGPPPRHYSPPQRSSLASLPHTSGLAYPYTPPCPLPTSEARLCPSPAADRVWHTRGRRRVSPKAAPKPSPSCHLPAYL
jgi:hypothetical protein